MFAKGTRSLKAGALLLAAAAFLALPGCASTGEWDADEYEFEGATYHQEEESGPSFGQILGSVLLGAIFSSDDDDDDCGGDAIWKYGDDDDDDHHRGGGGHHGGGGGHRR